MPTAQAGAWRETRPEGGHASVPVVVACVFCGCDLYPDPGATIDEVWFHFAPVGGRDANGCHLPCATSGHGADGWPRTPGHQA